MSGIQASGAGERRGWDIICERRGDPITHMWIMDRCVSVYTVRVVSLWVVADMVAVFSLCFFPSSSPP